jgi:ubiquinone/menaquinone biosynthesis C-methylase UbiE
LTLWGSRDAAEHWAQGAAVRNRALAAATARMLDLAGVGHRSRVLALAAGTGEEAFEAAGRVGADGFVLATDISGEMLEIARRQAETADLANVATRVMRIEDAGHLEEKPFDAAICRFGLMFLPDLGAGLRAVLEALKPGARLAAMVWEEPEQNFYPGAGLVALRAMGRQPHPDATLPRAFSLSGDRLPSALRAAGYADVVTETARVARRFANMDEALENLRTTPATGDLIQDLDAAAQEEFWARVRELVSRHEGPDGVEVPGLARLAAGARPA